MAATKISDVIVPDVFNPYVVERTSELTKIRMGGIVGQDENLNALAQRGGKLINMPFWSDLTGDDEVLSDSGSLTVNAIGSGQDVAALLMRGKAWGVNDLAKALSGDDPMRAIGDLVADYWVRKQQATLIQTLEGVFADNVANDSGDMVSNVAIEDGDSATSASLLNGTTLVGAIATMGDMGAELEAIVMHSVCYNNLQIAQAITLRNTAVPGSETPIEIPTFHGLRVIVDDSCPVVAGGTSGYKYTSYLFASGAIGLGEGSAPVPTETDRDALAGEDQLITRRHYLLHPRGIAFQSGSVAGSSPTNAELALAANWSRVYERNNIRIAQLVTNG